MRHPEGYSLKSITLAREIKTLPQSRSQRSLQPLKSITLAREIKTIIPLFR